MAGSEKMQDAVGQSITILEGVGKNCFLQINTERTSRRKDANSLFARNYFPCFLCQFT